MTTTLIEHKMLTKEPNQYKDGSYWLEYIKDGVKYRAEVNSESRAKFMIGKWFEEWRNNSYIERFYNESFTQANDGKSELLALIEGRAGGNELTGEYISIVEFKANDGLYYTSNYDMNDPDDVQQYLTDLEQLQSKKSVLSKLFGRVLKAV